jgi:transcriptional regulator with XRE-family HTH domain
LEGSILNIGERVKYLRKDVLGITQDDFSKKIKISRGNIASIETLRINITDRVISDICCEFNVSEEWLRTGDGEMFVPSPSGLGSIATLAKEFSLTSLECTAIEKFVSLDPNVRQSILKFMLDIAHSDD